MTDSLGTPSSAWLEWRASVDLDEYDRRWVERAAAGESVHGEADAVDRLLEGPSVIVDGGCGTGRVALELDRRGHRVIGIDNDPDLLDRARAHRSGVEWRLADLTTVEPTDPVDLVALPGNVLVFARPLDRPAIVANLGRFLVSGGRLVAGFSLGFESSPTVEELRVWLAEAGLELVEEWSTWEGDPYAGGDYVVSVARRH